MNINETKEFMERIKIHYPSFIIDTYTIEEWHKELKDYSFEDINKKFEEHLRNEQYGNNIPRIWFLTKYLTKEADKGKNNASDIKTNCQLCGKEIILSEYSNHYHKCSSVDYIIRQVKKYKGQELPRKDIEELTDEKFDKLYDKVLNLTFECGTPDEKKYIAKYRESESNETLE